MNKIEELQEEIEALKAKQELHRRQLEENRRTVYHVGKIS